MHTSSESITHFCDVYHHDKTYIWVHTDSRGLSVVTIKKRYNAKSEKKNLVLSTCDSNYYKKYYGGSKNRNLLLRNTCHVRSIVTILWNKYKNNLNTYPWFFKIRILFSIDILVLLLYTVKNIIITLFFF